MKFYLHLKSAFLFLSPTINRRMYYCYRIVSYACMHKRHLLNCSISNFFAECFRWKVSGIHFSRYIRQQYLVSYAVRIGTIVFQMELFYLLEDAICSGQQENFIHLTGILSVYKKAYLNKRMLLLLNKYNSYYMSDKV